MFRFTLLASGSEGNALVVQAGTTCLLIDSGLSAKRLAEALARVGLEPTQLAAILVTHEHDDHIGGVVRAANRWRLPVYGTWGTLKSVAPWPETVDFRPLESLNAFPIGELEVQPFAVPHDAREPVQYTFSYRQQKLGLLTDTGHITPHIRHHLDGCNALILETNHDPELLRQSRYPPHLIRRIAGDWGHLSNQQAAQLLADIDTSRLQHLIAAHLSQENNQAELAQSSLAAALECAPDWIVVASQQEGVPWRIIHPEN